MKKKRMGYESADERREKDGTKEHERKEGRKEKKKETWMKTCADKRRFVQGAGLKPSSVKVFLSYRATEAHSSAPAAGRRPDVSADPAERKLDLRRWADHPEGGGIPYDVGIVDRDARCQLATLQTVAPRPRHRVRDPRPVDTPRRGRDRKTWPRPHHAHQVRR